MAIAVEQGRCIDCGKEAGGLRCRRCHGRFLKRTSLEETATRDRELLQWVDGPEKLRAPRVADRMGISQKRALELIALARSREAERQALGI